MNSYHYHARSASAVGVSNHAYGNNASAFGDGNTAGSAFINSNNGVSFTSDDSAFGYRNSATAGKSTAVGYKNVASKADDSAIGYANTASGYLNGKASAFGFKNSASGDSSVAVGSRNYATGASDNAFGYGNKSGGDLFVNGYHYYHANSASAVGVSNHAYGNNASAFGDGNTAGSVNGGQFHVRTTVRSAMATVRPPAGARRSATKNVASKGPTTAQLAMGITLLATSPARRAHSASRTPPKWRFPARRLASSNTASQTMDSALGSFNTATGVTSGRASAPGFNNQASGDYKAARWASATLPQAR